MSANTWYAISLVGYFAAVIGLIVTAVLYFRLDILDVIGDLTGRTVTRELKSMRENRDKRGVSTGSRIRKISKTSGTSKSAKSSLGARKYATRKTGGRPVDIPESFSGKKGKHGTAQMGSSTPVSQPDKMVLHSRTDRLNKETEELYEDFDPRVEYARMNGPEQEGKTSGGTAVLKSGTDILEETPVPRRGTQVLMTETEYSYRNETALLVEEKQAEPIKFRITRSYLIVHSEEMIG